MTRLTCESCKNTLGYLSNTCSNPKCLLYNQKQKGVIREYNNDLVAVSHTDKNVNEKLAKMEF